MLQLEIKHLTIYVRTNIIPCQWRTSSCSVPGEVSPRGSPPKRWCQDATPFASGLRVFAAVLRSPFNGIVLPPAIMPICGRSRSSFRTAWSCASWPRKVIVKVFVRLPNSGHRKCNQRRVLPSSRPTSYLFSLDNSYGRFNRESTLPSPNG